MIWERRFRFSSTAFYYVDRCLNHFVHLWICRHLSAVMYAENFHGGVSFSAIWWSFVCGVRSLWRHNLTSCSCFQTNVLAKFVDIICIFFYTHSPYVMCHCTEYKLLVLQFRISVVSKRNASTQEFITAKFLLRVEGEENTHHCVRAIYICNIRLRWCLVECEQSGVSVWLDWLTHTRVCKIESCWTTQQGCQPVLIKKKQYLVPKKPDSSFEA